MWNDCVPTSFFTKVVRLTTEYRGPQRQIRLIIRGLRSGPRGTAISSEHAPELGRSYVLVQNESDVTGDDAVDAPRRVSDPGFGCLRVGRKWSGVWIPRFEEL